MIRFFTLSRSALLLTTRREGQLLLNRQCIHQNNKQKLLADFNYYLNSGSQSDTILIQCIKACADGLLSEQPQKKIWLADNMVKKVKESGLESNVQVKNSLLQVYLQNHHKFSPSLFLQDMKDENILPNRGTMFLLLRGYCQQGNMEGAKGILQEIQANDIPINEEVYASLITCHAMCNEMNEAKDLLQVMKDSGLEPKQTAYSALLSGYAYHGDLESVQRTIEEMRSQRVYAGHSMYVEMLDALSLGGHSNRMKELLDVIRNKQWMYNDLLEKTQVFASRGDINSTLCLLECLLDIKTVDDSSGPLKITAAVALRLLSISDKPFTDLLPSLSFFQKVGLSLKECYEILIWKCFDTKNWSDLQEVLDKMKSEGTPVKSFYLYPPFADCGVQKNVEGIMHWLSVCKSYGIPMDRNIFMFCMKAFNEDFLPLFDKISESGLLSEEGTLPCIVEFLCIQEQHSNLNHLCKYISEQPLDKLPITGLFGAVHKVIQAGPNFYKLFSTVINTLSSLPLDEEAFQKLRGLVHFGVSRVVHVCEPNDAIKVVKSFLEKNPSLVSNDTSRLVMSILNNKGLTKELIEFIRMLQSYNVEFDCAQHRVVIKMAGRVPHLAGTALASFNAMKQQGCGIDDSVYSHMISALVKGQRSGLALSFYNELIARESIPSLAVYSILVRSLLYTGQFPAALKIRGEMEAAGITPNVSMLNTFIESYGRRGDVEKCREEFESVKEKNEFTYQSLMIGYCYHGDVAGATSVFEEARSAGMTGTKRMASILLETYLNAKDLEGAVSLLEKFDDVRPDFISCNRLINECEVARRRDLTEKSLNFVTSLGLSKIDIDFMFTFAMMKSQQFDEAVEFVKSKNYSNDKIATAVKHYLSETNKIENLPYGIRILDHFEIDPVSVYTDLAKNYADSRNFDGVLAIKKALEYSNKTLSVSFLALVKSILKKENITREKQV